MLSEKLKVMIVLVIFGVIIAIIEILWFILPLIAEWSSAFGVLFILFLVVLGVNGVFVLMTLRFGLEHPKWYVKLYTVICSFWEFFCAFLFYGAIMGMDEIWFHTSIALAFPPLMTIWYFCYKEYKEDTLRYFWHKEEQY